MLHTIRLGNGRLKEIAYANGDKMKATYNGIGQMTAEKWLDKDGNLTAHYKYVYDGQGNIVKSIDLNSKKEYNYLYEDGKIVQSTESDIVLNENDFVTSKAFVCAVRYYYGAEDKLTKKHIKFADGKEHTVLYENTENDSQVVRFTANGRTITSHSKTDSFGRKVFDELQLGAGFLSRQFSYTAGAVTDEHINNNMLKSTPTTSLVSRIVLSNGLTLTYGYDEEERITSVTETRTVDGVPTASTTLYTYDALGQLLTETVNGEVVNTMTYDNYGNILSKNGVAYTYGDGDWKDLLTSYNGRSITYDKQGNPINYLGHTLTWEKGRQLKTFDGNTYTYNANGIRKSKTVYGIRHDFVLDGAKILRETWDNNTLIPLYDNEDNVCGIEYNGAAYYFLKNLQGDVIAITDNSGEEIARYSYDAWGVCTVTQDTSDCDIATVNPYRYRSYYYDDEIDMYYLQSRYYNPTVGRFINADMPELLLVSNCSLNCNLFGYCENDCITRIDDSGHISLNMRSLRSRFWLARFISRFVAYTSEREKKILSINLRWLGIKMVLSAIAGTSSNVGAFFSVGRNSLSCSAGGVSFSAGSGKVGVSASATVFSTTLKGFAFLSKRDITFGFSLVNNLVQNRKKVYFGIKFAVSISYVTIAVAAGALAAAAVFVPAFAPVASKIAYGAGRLVANARASVYSICVLLATALRGVAAFC